ncbi:hypothetical protein SAMN06265173_102106 [Thalassovita litoralis]|jgi:hypothetical protein|uniref:Uncharacterized protein n=1 Tax=Thalassovita litoralis TaxID=1010611 RepID=A0A521B4J9_9RHOB|nr:hypothetical protein SAMN06265173_102106 [Thalassovita litoralis]
MCIGCHEIPVTAASAMNSQKSRKIPASSRMRAALAGYGGTKTAFPRFLTGEYLAPVGQGRS